MTASARETMRVGEAHRGACVDLISEDNNKLCNNYPLSGS